MKLDTNTLFDGAETFPEMIIVTVSAIAIGCASYAIGAPIVFLASWFLGAATIAL